MHRRFIAALFALSLALVATGFYLLSFFEGPPTAVLQRHAPRDADVFVSVFLRPSTAQQAALRDLFGDEESATSTVESVFDSVLTRFNMRFSNDVRPWAGDEAGAFLVGTDYGVLLEAADTTAAYASAVGMLTRGSSDAPIEAIYERAHFSFVKRFRDTGLPLAAGIVEDVLVIGTPVGLRAAVDAVAGESLSDDQDFDGLISPLTTDRLGTIYVKDPDSLVSRLPGSLNFAFGALGVQGSQYRAIVFAEPEALVVESTDREPLRLTPQMLSGFLQFEI